MAYHYGKFVWFEHVSRDIAAARRFYAELFGWKSDGVPIGAGTYHMIQNGTQAIGGFHPALPAAPDPGPGGAAHWMGYLSVPDVDAACTTAAKAGATVVMPPTDFAAVGRGATLADPQGATFSLWKSADGDRDDLDPVPVGDWFWNELMTSDDQAGLRFYESVFGFTHDSMSVPNGVYHVLKQDGVARAGLMRTPSPGGPSFWIPYVRVADCDASLARAETLGAKSMMPPMEVEGVGRFAFFVDPGGAMLAIIKSFR